MSAAVAKPRPHSKPAKLAGRWEMCPRCEQVRAVGAPWKRACLPRVKPARYMAG